MFPAARSRWWWLNLALLIPAIASMYAAASRALRFSMDFQWLGAHLLWLHIDPWQTYLRNWGRLWSIQPAYLHELYVLLLPFALLRERTAVFAWATANLAMTALSVYLIGRIFELGRDRTATLFLLLVCSGPFRAAVGNGQTAILLLFWFTLLFYLQSTAWRGVLLGLSYAKYNFAPVWFLYFLFRRRFRLLLVALLPPLAGWLIAWAMIGGNGWTVLTDPLQALSNGMAGGTADVMTLVRVLMRGSPFAWMMSLLAGTVASIALSAYLATRGPMTRTQEMACLAIASLLCLYHSRYDFVLLTPVAAYASLLTPAAGGVVLALVAVFWYTPGSFWLLDPSRPLDPQWSAVPGVMLLAVLLLVVIRAVPSTLASRE
jgi:uncharacterized integral membrane protein